MLVSRFRPFPVLAATTLLIVCLATPLRALEAPQAPAWPDTFTARLGALALVQTLNAELLNNPSATLTLDRWCASHRLASDGAKIVADRIRDDDRPASPQVREALGVGPDEPVKYRRVKLRCGERVLSEADNWYVPALLTEDMNRQLDTTDTSFGRVVQPLGFRRQTLAARLLWQPLPQEWEMGAALPPGGAAPLAVPPYLLEHRAVLTLPDGRAFSALVETYTSGVLAFPWLDRP
ncbi:hypothetical protein [Ancylobacter terrae]|uniref:hypothetical protein n=1 Tax=Ancylobacter sp. sgz301288 TaxID=3342077 RepID=UPI00385ABFA2